MIGLTCHGATVTSANCLLPEPLKSLASHTWQDEHNVGAEWVPPGSLKRAARSSAATTKPEACRVCSRLLLGCYRPQKVA